MSNRKHFLIIGWPECPFYQKAIQEFQSRGMQFTTLDERTYGPVLCKDLPTYGQGMDRWRSPHIFQYVGGSSDLENQMISSHDQLLSKVIG